MKRKTIILLILLVMFILVILTFIGIFYCQTIDTSNKNLETLAHSKLSYGSKRLTTGQKLIEDNASTILIDDTVKKLRDFSISSDSDDYLTTLSDIKLMLKQRLINGSEMASITVYWPQREIMISTETNLLMREEMKIKPKNGKEWRSTARGFYFFMDYSFGNNKGNETIVAIEMSDELILATEDAVSLESSESVLIMPDNTVVGGTQTLQKLVSNHINTFKKSDNLTFEIEGNKGKFMKVRVPNSKIIIATTIPTNSNDITYTRNTILIICATIFVICFGFALLFLFYRNVVSEISLLTSKLKEVEKGNYDTRIKHTHNNEFNYLFTQFNQMVSSIQKLLQLLTKEMKQRELAEGRQFQTQIQPHFLYNSLFYIVSVAHDPSAVIEMTRHLTEYYRYLTKKSDVVIIKDEVKFAHHYLTIQALRKEFQFNIKIDKSIEEYPILPLLIQPIIENAIEHGIEAKDGANLIELQVRKNNDKCFVIVSDNGPGMSKNDIKELMVQINSQNSNKNSVGLWNVNQRLVNYYGRESKLYIEANRDGGLLVKFEFKPKKMVSTI
ncbi:hypothetical protein T481_11910 [Enterococcus faecalis PF3]|nr:hypothetical protein T481_11910 [Enterococcus faecalis PF3]